MFARTVVHKSEELIEEALRQIIAGSYHLTDDDPGWLGLSLEHAPDFKLGNAKSAVK